MRKPKTIYTVLFLLVFIDSHVLAEDAAAQNDDAAVQNGNNQAGDDQVQEVDNQIQQEDDLVYYQDFEGDYDNGNGNNAKGDDYYWLENNQDYQNNYYDNEGNNNNNNNDAANGDENENADGVYQSQVQVCSDSVIQVQDVVSYCDSPGTFYYGSGKYRNSQYCQPGDKASVIIDFYIANQNLIQQAGNKALLDIYATGGEFTEDVIVYDSADMCSLSSLKSKSHSQCPYNGYYQIKAHFYWGKDGENESFVPTIVVGFKSSMKKQVYDFGGANTDACRGSTFLTWSDGVSISYANAMSTFLKSFGVLLLTILSMGLFAFFLVKRPRNLSEAKARLLESRRGIMRKVKDKYRRSRDNVRNLSIHEGDEFDFHKITKSGNGDLVDL